MNYTVDYFIKKFEAIPEKKWCMYKFRIEGKKCFIGHTIPDHLLDKIIVAGDDGTGMTSYCFTQEDLNELSETRALVKLIHPNQTRPGESSNVCYQINNGDHSDYKQSTPKQRVLAALYDIKAKEIQISEVHEVLQHQTVNL